MYVYGLQIEYELFVDGSHRSVNSSRMYRHMRGQIWASACA
jgi:hypothetical protein